MSDPKIEKPKTAFFYEHICSLVSYHAPRPVISEHHHRKPAFLQKRVYGKVLYDADMWLCSNCHEAVHAWLYYILGERDYPLGIGRLAKAEAERTFDWYSREKIRLEIEQSRKIFMTEKISPPNKSSTEDRSFNKNIVMVDNAWTDEKDWS